MLAYGVLSSYDTYINYSSITVEFVLHFPPVSKTIMHAECEIQIQNVPQQIFDEVHTLLKVRQALVLCLDVRGCCVYSCQ